MTEAWGGALAGEVFPYYPGPLGSGFGHGGSSTEQGRRHVTALSR